MNDAVGVVQEAIRKKCKKLYTLHGFFQFFFMYFNFSGIAQFILKSAKRPVCFNALFPYGLLPYGFFQHKI